MTPIKTAKVISVIEVVTTRGRGVEGDPVRNVTTYHSFMGKLLAEDDPGAHYVEKRRIDAAIEKALGSHRKEQAAAQTNTVR